MTRKIAVINQKGGVGKTTTTANLGYLLAENGSTVTLIDLDPQSSLTVSLGVDWREHKGIEDVLLHGECLEDVVVKKNSRLNLVASGNHLGQAEHIDQESSAIAKKLRDVIAGIEDDYVLIDCPPSSGFLIVSALYAVDEVLIPIAADYLTLHGLSHLIGTIQGFEQRIGHSIAKRFVVTRYHPRRRLANDVREKLHVYFPGEVLETCIRESSSLAEAPGFGKTIYEYQRNSNGCEDYRKLAAEFAMIEM